jgi:tetratricopeptide (TPR) repeat protein
MRLDDMSELRQLLEFRGGNFTVEMFASPALQAAYRVLLEGDVAEAEVRFRRIIDEHPKDHEALAGLAVCTAEDGGRFLTAEKMAKQSVRLAPKSAAGYIALGYINLRGARLEDGYRYLMKAKHLAPRDPRLAAGFAIYDRERPPVIADLSRLHPVNRALGGIRAGLRSPAQRAMGLACLAVSIYMASSLIG